MNYDKIRLKNKDRNDDWDEVHNQLLAVQKKSLEISDPDDTDEKEADAVARKVINGESAEIHGTGSAINRSGEGSAEATPEFQSKLKSKKGSGQSLDTKVRGEMESKMDADFSSVKIHTGNEASQMSESINAKAFTHGQDIFFGSGEFDTNSKQGKELLAHELVHTQQQSREKISRRILIAGAEASAASLLPAVTVAVNTWYPAIVAGVTAQAPSFTPATDMPFTQAGAVTRAKEILNEMQDARFMKEHRKFNKKKGKEESEFYRDDYDFNFNAASDVSDEVVFRLALIVNMHLANMPATAFARYPTANEGFNLQNPVWNSIPANTTYSPGGFQLQAGNPSAAAIIQLTTPPVNVNQRIVIDCSTMMGIIYYKTLVGTTPGESTQFNTKIPRPIVGPITATYNNNLNTPHSLTNENNPDKSPYLKKVHITDLNDLVPGDTVIFSNYSDYGKIDPTGLWNGEWGIYTRKVGKTMYFEGFGVAEDTYENIIQLMQTAYDNAWLASSQKTEKVTEEKTVLTIEGKRPGISCYVFRIDLTTFNQ